MRAFSLSSLRVHSYVHLYPAAMALVLYVIICSRDKADCELNRAIPARYVTPRKNYIGLRERVVDAVESHMKILGPVVTVDTHEGLKATCAAEGVGLLTLQFSGSENHFASTLAKVRFWDKEVDWQTWHYIGDLPLQDNVTYDEKLYTAEWLPLSAFENV